MAVLVVLTLTACTEDEGQRVELGDDTAATEGRAAWSPELTARVDSANAAYAAEDYETAAEIYGALTEEYADNGTVWFGLYMAENALGNTDAAAAALERAEAINPGLGQMHQDAQTEAETGSMPQMPAGHPPMDSADAEDAPPLTVQHPEGGDTSGGR